jgi:hypothetical protein
MSIIMKFIAKINKFFSQKKKQEKRDQSVAFNRTNLS